MTLTCYDYALQYLSRYPKSSFELWKQLKKKWYEDQEIGETIEKLENIWFLDDALYADMYIHSEVVRKWKPVYLIKQKLHQKWIDRTIVEEVCMTYEEEIIAGQHAKIEKEIQKREQRQTTHSTQTKQRIALQLNCISSI